MKRERYRTPLQGIPFGAKDLLSVAGQVTTWGAKPYATQVFTETATVLEKLDKTGALLIGKLAMVELAGGGGYRTAAASLFGPGLNPWDITRLVGRFVKRFGQRGGGGACPVCAGFGDVGIHPYAFRLLRRHRVAADLRPGQPPRRHGAFLDDGQDRPDVPQRRRLRPGAADHRGRRFEGPRFGGEKLLLHAAIRPEAHGPEDRFRARRYGMGRSRRRARRSRPPCR